MVAGRSIHYINRADYNFLLFHTGQAQLRCFGFASCRDCCKIIHNGFFSITRDIFLPSEAG